MHAVDRKKIIISVINDLVTDQRVNRAALTLYHSGMDVILVGRKLKKSLPVDDRPYQTKRFRLWFEKGPLFYAAYNLRLLFFLLFEKADFYLSNDLDTLLPNFISSRIKKVPLVYDSHEYFTEVPELINHPFKRLVWVAIEKWIFPKLKYVMTVNNSIAKIYSEKYRVDVQVVRNVPFTPDKTLNNEQRITWHIPENKKVFLFQGAGINIDRGAEEAIRAIEDVDNAVLLFIGGGDVIDKLKDAVRERSLNHKVFFIPKQPMYELIRFTRMADFGITLDKATNLNYRYSLPNKLFDYIHANLPVLSTDLTEVKCIIEKYDIGMITSSYDPQSIVKKMREMISDENRIAQWKKNLNIAAAELCWENEQQRFLEVFINAGRK
jgi:glycosyltransferase involved in cell wall biosynthesis